ncbi:hypothetical protein [Tenacibaculum aiptasiae]|uniref:hypothetical protein n=1 Tax=Tenacibaculum aiptasiae TaxID=426481 RepID=UPI003B5A67D8
MKRLKYFIASAGSLKEERESIETYLSRKNDSLVDKGIYLEVVIWEKLSSSFSSERKQNEFNKALLESDVLICLAFDRVGPFTYEEFDNAVKSFNKGGNPKKIYMYFKNGTLKASEITAEFQSVLSLKEEIKKYEQVYNEYENVAELLLDIEKNFTLDLAELVKKSLKEELIELLNEINPEILQRFNNGTEQTCVLISPQNLQKLNNMKNELEAERLLTYFSNGNVVMGMGNRIGNCINDKQEGMMNGFELVKLENL